MKQINIKTARTLSAAIDAIVKESIKASLYNNGLDEKERQKKLMGEEDDDVATDNSNEDTGGGDDQQASSKTMDDEKEKLKKGEIKPKDIVDKLNTIRSGKSFKDSSVSGKLDEYVESLSKAEKVALLAFLKGISQIVTGEVEPDKAINPADPDPSVKMEKGNTAKKKTIKPNVIRAPEKTEKSKSPSAEDTSGPTPITPKKK